MYVRRTVTAATLLAGALASGCGATAAMNSCEVPASLRQADEALQGRWNLVDRAGEVVGAVEIRGDRASILSTPDETTFFGRMTIEQRAASEFLLVLDVDSAEVRTVRQQYGDVTRLPLTLVFAEHDVAYSLQADGLWLRWERVP